MTESDEAFLKYNPDQPRIPAGNPDGGQWTNGEGGGNGENSPDDSNAGPDHEAVDNPRTLSPSRVIPAGTKYPTSAVQSLDDAKRIVREANGKYLGKDQACASLVHALAPDLPATSLWKPGDIIQGNMNIPVGTPSRHSIFKASKEQMDMGQEAV